MPVDMADSIEAFSTAYLSLSLGCFEFGPSCLEQAIGSVEKNLVGWRKKLFVKRRKGYAYQEHTIKCSTYCVFLLHASGIQHMGLYGASQLDRWKPVMSRNKRGRLGVKDLKSVHISNSYENLVLRTGFMECDDHIIFSCKYEMD